MIQITLACNQAALDECLQIRRKVFIEEKNVPESIEIDEHDILDGKCDHFVIGENADAIGTLRCMYLDESTIKLQRFCILPQYRGLGMGRKMLELVEDYYKGKSVSRIELNAKFEVAQFYEKCGYTVISDRFLEAGIPHIKMAKDISSHGKDGLQ